MSEVSKLIPPELPFQELLAEQGTDVQSLNESFVIPTLDTSTLWRTTRFYGVESQLASGGVARMVVRQVEQLPDLYTLSHPATEMTKFESYRHRGVLADIAVRSIGIGHLLLARSTIMQTANIRATSFSGTSNKVFNIGRIVMPQGLLEFDPTSLAGGRQLDESEIGYTEPTLRQLLLHGIHTLPSISKQ